MRLCNGRIACGLRGGPCQGGEMQARERWAHPISKVMSTAAMRNAAQQAPSPMWYLAAAEALKADPARCLVIEDIHDRRAGRRGRW